MPEDSYPAAETKVKKSQAVRARSSVRSLAKRPKLRLGALKRRSEMRLAAQFRKCQYEKRTKKPAAKSESEGCKKKVKQITAKRTSQTLPEIFLALKRLYKGAQRSALKSQ